MWASKLALHGIFRAPPSLPPNPPSLPFHTLPLRFQRSSFSAAAATDDTSSETLPLLLHPWPEWVSFIDRLKTTGYLASPEVDPSSPSTTTTASSDNNININNVYGNINLLKNACLTFARDRYDLLTSLSEEDIQTVAKAGCPNLLRKVVNSAKRLRAHVGLDEGDVCSTCKLRDSCDRAYVILKAPEDVGRTVDVVRILLSHALDSQLISGGGKPPGREDIELSARKLLSELVELSESSTAPAPPKLLTKQLKPKEPKDQSISLMSAKVSKDDDAKLGDWTCPKCNFFNFARNTRCLKCNTQDLMRVSANTVERKQNAVERKKGDWDCSKCGFVNFSRNQQCRQCKADGPRRASFDEIERKKGDWDCPRCEFLNFASKKKCLRCSETRPMGSLGDWYCPKCDFFNFGKNKQCLKCNSQRPLETTRARGEDHEWIRPS